MRRILDVQKGLFLHSFVGSSGLGRKTLRSSNQDSAILSLRAGDWVEVRSREEIAATLDVTGKLDGLPFMTEMLSYCGRRFQVIKRANKTCDEATSTLRGLRNTVHLESVRCDGGGHGGCDAGCLIFWDERWLKRFPYLESLVPRPSTPNLLTVSQYRPQECSAPCEKLLPSKNAGSNAGIDCDNSAVFSCQATEISGFSCPLPWWDVRQYWEDIYSGNVTFLRMLIGLIIGARSKMRDILRRPPRKIFGVGSNTPKATLDLQPGDMVQIKSKEEILKTLDPEGKNRGLAFANDMSLFCTGTFRVSRRVQQIVHPKSGKMIDMKGECVILGGVVCLGRHKRFCPRMVNLYWRDVWLKRVDSTTRA